MTSKFQIGDLVWAKMKGYSPWPGIISAPGQKKPPNKKCLWVFFFGSENYGWIEMDNIKPYEAHKTELSTSAKSSSFKQALLQIEQYIERKQADPTYELELPERQVNVDTPKNEKTTKRTKDTITKSAKRPRNSSKVEENGASSSQLISEELAELDGSSYRAVSTDLNHFDDEEICDTSNADDASNKTESALPSNKTFGFIGLGGMGKGIVQNLINAGHRVNLWNRSIDKCDEIKANSEANKYGLVEVYSTPCDLIHNSDIIFSCLANPKVANEIILGNCGLLWATKDNKDILKNKGYIEMTTMDPETSADHAEALQAAGCRYLEAQIQGSRKEAEMADLVLLCAGDRSLFNDCHHSCFKAMGKTSIFLGEVGFACKMNLVMNLLGGVTLAALVEAMALADRCGLSFKSVLKILHMTNFANPYLEDKGQRIYLRNFQVADKPLEHMQRDLKYCLDMSDMLRQSLPLAAAANEICKQGRRMGLDGQDCSSLFLRSKQ